MADIEKLIQDLQNDDLETRYNACKQLEIEPQLSEEALDALLTASRDPEPLIAVAAYHALGANADTSTNHIIQEIEAQWSLDRNTTNPTNQYQYWGAKDPLFRNIFVGGSAFTAFSTCFISIWLSDGFTQAIRWAPLLPVLFIIYSFGVSIISTLATLAITSKYLGRKDEFLILVLSLATGFCIGILAGFSCNAFNSW